MTLLPFSFIAIACAIGILVVIVGLVEHRKVVSSNPCAMTYSYGKKSKVEMTEAFSTPAVFYQDYKLWKYSNTQSSKLNPHPVLFIHGHMGR